MKNERLMMKKKGFIPEKRGYIKTGLTQPFVWVALFCFGEKIQAWGWFAIGCMDFLAEM